MPAGRCPHADDRITARRIARRLAVARDVRQRNLQRDRVDAEAIGRIDAGRRGDHRRQVEVLERPQVAQVEDRADVDIEAIQSLSGEHRPPAAQGSDRLLGERGIVGRGRRPDVAGRAGQVAPEHTRAARVGTGHRVELLAVPVRAPDRRDRPDVVQERVGVGDLHLKCEVIGDIGATVTVVVDLDRVEHVGRELKEVRSAERRLKRQIVGDERHRVRFVR